MVGEVVVVVEKIREAIIKIEATEENIKNLVA